MISPFPGMDPYIESKLLWPDFHNDMAGEIRARLNQTLDPIYTAITTPYVTYQVIQIDKDYGIRPDVGVLRTPEIAGGVAIAPAPTITSYVTNQVTVELRLKLHRVEVRFTDNKKVVTMIEILSPVNKQASHKAYHDYLRKQRDILRSEVHFIELDFLRGGTRPPLVKPVPKASYYVMLSRVEERPNVAVWPIQLIDPLPTIPIPLQQPDPDVVLNLNDVVATIYQRGAYQRQINYSQPPPAPVLSDREQSQVSQLLTKTNQII